MALSYYSDVGGEPPPLPPGYTPSVLSKLNNAKFLDTSAQLKNLGEEVYFAFPDKSIICFLD